MYKRFWVGLALANPLRLVIPVILLVLAGRTFNTDAQTETILYSFGGSTNDGSSPNGLVQGRDGNFYGTTSSGGTSNAGTVFRISPSGTHTTLYSFVGSPSDGSGPNGLVQGSDGNFYGTAGGGTSNAGTVFRISPSGSETNLYSFGSVPNDGRYLIAGLVQGSDGNFYGATEYGGTNDYGTVFRISPSGSYTNLHSFVDYPTDGRYPEAGLVQGSDGNFYGTTAYGGTLGIPDIGDGSVFRISPNGSETTLYSFGGLSNDGILPRANLVQGNDGNFYGTTVIGGTTWGGTVFQISPSGSYTSLYSFGSSPGDGGNPQAALVQGSDGNFYGIAEYGGTNGVGTVFRISPSGAYTNLYSFGGSPSDGGSPASLVQGSDGNLYGTTYGGGTSNDGVVFKLTVRLNPPANQISEIQFFNVQDSTIVALPIPSVAGETYQLQYTDSMSPTNWLNTGGTFTSIGGPLVLIDLAEPLPPQRFYRAVITP